MYNIKHHDIRISRLITNSKKHPITYIYKSLRRARERHYPFIYNPFSFRTHAYKQLNNINLEIIQFIYKKLKFACLSTAEATNQTPMNTIKPLYFTVDASDHIQASSSEQPMTPVIIFKQRDQITPMRQIKFKQRNQMNTLEQLIT